MDQKNRPTSPSIASQSTVAPEQQEEIIQMQFNKQLMNPSSAILKRQLKSNEELDRLTTEQFFNPFDVLYLGIEATEEDIKKMFRSFSMILHPDKCKDPRAGEAFHTIDQAYRVLQDVEKRKVYVRIMREAREKTEFDRSKESKRRIKQGLPPLPDDTFESDYRKTCKLIFTEIEDRKQHLIRLEQSQKKQKIEEYERRKMLEQYKVLTEQEWEDTRNERVGKWRDFNTNKKTSIGTKMSDKGIRAPPEKMEQRPVALKKDSRKNEEEQIQLK